MKKFLFAVLVLLTAVSCGKRQAVFTGKISGLKPESNVSILDISDPTHLIPIEVDHEGNYRFKIKNGPCTRHLIVDDPKGGVKFYAEPGMEANIDIEFKRTENQGIEEVYETIDTYSGDNKDAYVFLKEGDFYSEIQNPVIMAHYDAKDLTFDQFEKELKELLNVQLENLKNIKSPVFREWMEKDYEKKLRASYGWFTELSTEGDPSFKKYIESLDRNNNLNDAQMFMSGYSRFWLPSDQDRDLAWFGALNDLFTNKKIIRSLADERISRVLRNAPSNINEVFNAYKAVEPNRYVPEAIQSLYDHYKGLVPGAQAMDFDMYDMEGNKVMLSDLKGKAIYIDCWATWCGPCRAQTPYMISLYEHYMDDPRIQIVSISLDKKEKIDTWKAVISEENLNWPQYIVNDEFESTLCKNYDITGIPRFLLFDKEGKILSLNAKRPSETDIIDWIENQLRR